MRRKDEHFATAPFVAVGYGVEPWTTMESATRLRRLNPSLPVLGMEIDPERVEAAQPFADPLTQFHLGGCALALSPGSARLIRAFNVLRQYEETDVAEAHATLGRYLLPGGLLIEGTSDPFGRLLVANLVRKAAPDETAAPLAVEGLLFSTSFRWGFEPQLFQPVLPKNLIHRVTPAQPMHDFFGAWTSAYQTALPPCDLGLRQLFTESARGLAARDYAIDTRPKLLSKGFLLWKRDERLAAAVETQTQPRRSH